MLAPSCSGCVVSTELLCSHFHSNKMPKKENSILLFLVHFSRSPQAQIGRTVFRSGAKQPNGVSALEHFLIVFPGKFRYTGRISGKISQFGTWGVVLRIDVMNNEESSAQMLQEYLHRHAGGFGHAIECELKQPDKSKRMISLPLPPRRAPGNFRLFLQAEPYLLRGRKSVLWCGAGN